MGSGSHEKALEGVGLTRISVLCFSLVVYCFFWVPVNFLIIYPGYGINQWCYVVTAAGVTGLVWPIEVKDLTYRSERSGNEN